jgi:hypothetical protein
MQHCWENVERGLYRDTKTGQYYQRIRNKDCGDTWQSLYTTKLTEARERLDARRAARQAHKLGLKVQPAGSKRTSIAKVIERYQSDGYPDKRGNPRKDGPHLQAETHACELLLKYFGDDDAADDLDQNAFDEYHIWRQGNVTRGNGHRTTDLDLNTLSNALNWAVRKKLIKENRVKSRVRYHSSTDARHCKAMAPENVDELHDIAEKLFLDRRSETLGWQALIEGMTGLRTNEALALRMNARSDEPGGVTEDGNSLCVRRSKKPGRDNPYCEVHAGLKALLAAHKAWHKKRYRGSPWYFPGRDKDAELPISKGALTQTLQRLFARKELKKKFISHGMRAFYVLVRRSNGILDSQIAWEINHVGGVATLEKVYGGVPPHWANGKGPRLSWIPRRKPAWESIKYEAPKAAKRTDVIPGHD